MGIETYPPLDVLAQPPSVGVRLLKAAAQNFLGPGGTAINWGTVAFDTDNMADSGGVRINIRTPGRYLVFLQMVLPNTSAGARRFFNITHMRGATGTIAARHEVGNPGGAFYPSSSIAQVFDCQAGDYFQAEFYHDSSSPNTLTIGASGAAQEQAFGAMLLSGNANGTPIGVSANIASQTVANNAAWNDLTLETPFFDTDAAWSSAAPARLYARKTGWYSCSGWLYFAAGGGGVHRLVRIAKNGGGATRSNSSGPEALAPIPATGDPRAATSWVVFLRAGDYITLQGYSDATGGSVTYGFGELSMVQIGAPTVTTRGAPAARIFASANQTFGTPGAIWPSYDTVLDDNDGMADLANDRLIIRTPGRYILTFRISYTGSFSGRRAAFIRVNDINVGGQSLAAAPSNETTVEAMQVLDLKAGDVVTTYGYVDGVTATLTSGTDPAAGKVHPQLTATMIQPISVAALNTPEAWREVGATGQPGFENGWINYGSGYQSAAFHKDPSGMVHLKGLIKGGSANVNAFTLPVGYRPAGHAIFAIPTNATFGNVYVMSGGGVQMASPISNAWASLDGISFRAA